jgi:hypothetical protein
MLIDPTLQDKIHPVSIGRAWSLEGGGYEIIPMDENYFKGLLPAMRMTNARR